VRPVPLSPFLRVLVGLVAGLGVGLPVVGRGEGVGLVLPPPRSLTRLVRVGSAGRGPVVEVSADPASPRLRVLVGLVEGLGEGVGRVLPPPLSAGPPARVPQRMMLLIDRGSPVGSEVFVAPLRFFCLAAAIFLFSADRFSKSAPLTRSGRPEARLVLAIDN
jgi:hypothetical protein